MAPRFARHRSYAPKQPIAPPQVIPPPPPPGGRPVGIPFDIMAEWLEVNHLRVIGSIPGNGPPVIVVVEESKIV